MTPLNSDAVPVYAIVYMTPYNSDAVPVNMALSSRFIIAYLTIFDEKFVQELVTI